MLEYWDSMLEEFTLFTLLRNDQEVIAKWFGRILPFVNDGLVSNICITCSARDNNHLKTLSSICNLTIVDIDNKTINEEDQLSKLDYYRYIWNKGINEIDKKTVLVLDDDVDPDKYIIQKMFSQKLENSIFFGMINYRNSENLMVSKLVDRPQEIYQRDLPQDPFVIEYGSPACMFGLTENILSVSSNLTGIESMPYHCTGFEIAKNARKKNIKLIAVPSVICKHG
jgi:hypothetical protein